MKPNNCSAFLIALVQLVATALLINCGGNQETQANIEAGKWITNESVNIDFPRAEMANKQLFPDKKINIGKKTKEDLEKAAKEYLISTNILPTGISTDDLYLKIAHCINGELLSDTCYVVFGQETDGIRAILPQLNFTIQITGGQTKLTSLRFRIVPNLSSIIKNDFLSEAEVISIAEEFLSEKGELYQETDLEIDEETIRSVEGKWKRVYELQIDNFHRIYISSDRKVWIKDERYPLHGNVTGLGVFRYDDFYPPDPLDNLALSYLKVGGSDDPETYTNESGDFFMSTEGSGNLNLALNGLWAEIHNVSGGEFNEDLILNIPFSETTDDRISITFNSPSPPVITENIAQVNAYYHVNYIHDWLRANGIGPEIDINTLVNVNDDTIGAHAYFCSPQLHADGSYRPLIIIASSRERFYGDGRYYLEANMSRPSVIYHEYGHLADDAIGGITAASGSLHEGWAYMVSRLALGYDHGGLSFINYPPVENSGNYISTCYQDYQPAHNRGEAWAQFVGDIYRSFVEKYGEQEGAARAVELFIPMLYAEIVLPQDGFVETLLRDDDDGDLSNGTPNIMAIIDAGLRHCIIQNTGELEILNPLPVTNFEIYILRPTWLHFTWTEPAANSESVSGYDKRYSPSPITEENFEEAVELSRFSNYMALIRESTDYFGTNKEFAVNCLEPEKDYYFAIRAVGNDGNSSLINAVSATTPPDITSPTIRDVSLEVSESGVSVNWRVMDDYYLPLESYIEYGTTQAYGGIIDGNTANKTLCLPYNDYTSDGPMELEPNVRYYFRIRAIDPSDNEGVSEPLSFFFDPDAPNLCGNGTIEEHEECDNGTRNNTASSGGCNFSCEFNPDEDSDGFVDDLDNCPYLTNIFQEDHDGDGIGDYCDTDIDNDGLSNSEEAVAGSSNYHADSDMDGIRDGADNCPMESNPGQSNHDDDSMGSACDPDMDNDGINNEDDACPFLGNECNEISETRPGLTGCRYYFLNSKFIKNKKEHSYLSQYCSCLLKTNQDGLITEGQSVKEVCPYREPVLNSSALQLGTDVRK